MGRLIFVGLGLWDADDMTLRARRVLQEADEVVAEFYTSHLFGTTLDDLAEAIGRRVEVLPREGVESGRDALLDRAERGTVAFVAAGDALTATTHQDLRVTALARGIDVEIVHGVSIKTAASGLLGLSDYKFGRTTTMVFPYKDFLPASPLEVVVENRMRGLHTLVLLDIQADKRRYMTAAEGAGLLVRLLQARAEGGDPVDARFLSEATPVCVVTRAGSPEPGIHAGPLGNVAVGEFGAPLHCLVVPGRLTEDEAAVVSMTTGFGFQPG